MCFMNEKTRMSLKKQKELSNQISNMIDENCINCPILIENRAKLGNKKAYKNCLEACVTLKNIQKKRDELLLEKQNLRRLLSEEKQGGRRNVRAV